MTLRTRHLLPAVAALAAVGAIAGSTVASAARTGDTASVKLPGTTTIRLWKATEDPNTTVTGTLLLNGQPVSGALVRIDRWVNDTPTDKNGTFTYPLDETVPARHQVAVADSSNAKVDGKSLSDDQKKALKRRILGSIDVGYGVQDIKTAKQSDGTILVSGRLAYADGKTPPQPVTIYTYQLSGTVTDSDGHPVVGAVVSTRTLDRSFWTISARTDTNGHYTSLFTASAEQPGNPVPFDIRIARGDELWEFPAGEQVTFRRLQSATMDIQLPPVGYAISIPVAKSYPGAIYEGLVVGVDVSGQVIKPVKATWATKDGAFTLVLPASAAGKAVTFWERSQRVFLTSEAKPGGPIADTVWPKSLPDSAVPRIGSTTLPK